MTKIVITLTPEAESMLERICSVIRDEASPLHQIMGPYTIRQFVFSALVDMYRKKTTMLMSIDFTHALVDCIEVVEE